MQNRYKIAIVGCSGVVGRTVLKVLEEKNFRNCTYTLFSSSKSYFISITQFQLIACLLTSLFSMGGNDI